MATNRDQEVVPLHRRELLEEDLDGVEEFAHDATVARRTLTVLRELPTGTVTFLFTDIEGSTRLLDELGDSYVEVLAGHRRVLRDAFERHGGVEVDTQGDAFFVAFADARKAAAAAVEAQAALKPGPVRVRMGLHTGEPIVWDEGYAGADVHRGARIAAAAHGGQVVVSERTATLLDGTDVHPLGAHRLKDLTEPQPLFQLGDGEFPPLESLNQSNLPVQPTPFLGRERELGEVLSLLCDGDVRLLTLTGPGGSGKTRIAVQAAAERVEAYPHGVWWVPLQAVRDPAFVIPAIASTLGATVELAEHVADRRLLLVLDNLEQVVEATPALGELLAACPHLRLLVTSRERLRLAAEREYAVPPFVEEEGVGFFLARARALRPAIEAGPETREICRRLDNLPLALELAAARLKALSPEQLLARLEERLPVLTGGARDLPERQRTLRAAIAWSHDLLSTEEQVLFRRLCVFAGGWSLEACEQVCGADLDTLESLVDKSLARFDGDRYALLETIREYAAGRLADAGEAASVGRRHAGFFLRLAESANLSVEAIEAGGQQRHDVVFSEQDNVRAALDWALDSDPGLGLRLAVALEMFWVDHYVEGIGRLEALLARAGDVPLELSARALRCLGGACDIAGETERAQLHYERSFAAYERLGDEWGQVHLQHRLGVVAMTRDDRAQARALWDDCLNRARAGGFRLLEAEAVANLGALEGQEGNLEKAVELTGRGLELARAIGFAWFEAIGLANLADLSLQLGRTDEAEEYAHAALELSRRMDDRLNTVGSLAVLALVARTRGDAERAGRLLGAVEAEEARAPLGRWKQDEIAGRVLAEGSSQLERGLEAGRRLSLQRAIEEALESA